MHVYRPRKIASEIAEQNANYVKGITQDIVDDKVLKQPRWKMTSAIRAAFRRLLTSLGLHYHDPRENLVPDDDIPTAGVVSKRTVCSRFGADSYINACHNLSSTNHINYRMKYMNISGLTLPKTLQAYLYRNRHYDYYVVPCCRNLFFTLTALISSECASLRGKRSSKNNLIKADQIDAIIEKYCNLRAHDNTRDEMQDCIAMLQEARPVMLADCAGKPAYYRNIMAFAKEQGIYEEYMTNTLLPGKRTNKLSQLAEQYYYPGEPKRSVLYSRYRGLGYSDQEAKFEACDKATFGDWFKISPIRNTLLSLTGIASLLRFFHVDYIV